MVVERTKVAALTRAVVTSHTCRLRARSHSRTCSTSQLSAVLLVLVKPLFELEPGKLPRPTV